MRVPSAPWRMAAALVLLPGGLWAAGGDVLWEREVDSPLGCGEQVTVAGRLVTLGDSVTGRDRQVVEARAYDLATGADVWSHLGRPGHVTAGRRSLAAAGAAAYLATSRPTSKFRSPPFAIVTAVSVESGAPLWRKAFRDPHFRFGVSAVAADEQRVLVFGGRQPKPGRQIEELMLVALDAATGGELWSATSAVSASGDGRFQEAIDVVAGRGRVVTVSTDHKTVLLRAHDVADGRLLWQRSLDAGAVRALVRRRDVIFTLGHGGGTSSLIEAHDLRGRSLWTTVEQQAFLDQLAVGRSVVAAYGLQQSEPRGRAALRTLQPDRGGRLWRRSERSTRFRSVAVSQGQLVTLGERPEGDGLLLRVYGGRTGQLRWSVVEELPGRALSACGLVALPELILAATQDGSIARIRAFEP